MWTKRKGEGAEIPKILRTYFRKALHNKTSNHYGLRRREESFTSFKHVIHIDTFIAPEATGKAITMDHCIQCRMQWSVR